jgi:hypothetical protein
VLPLVVAGERWLVVLMLTLFFRFVPKPRDFRRLLIDSIERRRIRRGRGGGAEEAGTEETRILETEPEPEPETETETETEILLLLLAKLAFEDPSD